MADNSQTPETENHDFEQYILSVLQVHSFLLTTFVRGQLNTLSETEADEVISSLLRDFASVDLPENVRTDEGTLNAISQRHIESQRILEQLLNYARPRQGEG